VLDGGDHFILVMHVERYARYRGEPLLFAQGQYAVTQSHPNVPTNRVASSTARGGDDEGPSLQRLLSTASQRMSAQFQKHREALGLTVSSARVLNRLGSGTYGVDVLERLTYLGHDAVEDALADLMAHGYVAKNPAALFELTSSGRDKNAAVAARAAAFTQDKLKGLPESDVAAAKRVLTALHDR
jgi:hypothetical protein